MNKIYIDIGSSTVKIYTYLPEEKELSLVRTQSINFKRDFDADTGISNTAQTELLTLLSEIRTQYPESTIQTFATALFRKLSESAQTTLKEACLQETGIKFNIISHDTENEYLGLSLVGNSLIEEPVLLINIGGGSTELIVMKEKSAVERENIDMGVGTINTTFPTINDSLANVTLEEVKSEILNNLPSLTHVPRIAFYGGGELTYMRLANYNLKENNLIDDPKHPSLISYADLQKRNKEIYTEVTLEDLEMRMPENPTWMHGARACSAIAQAICEKYGIQTIIPSDTNMIDGVIAKDHLQ